MIPVSVILPVYNAAPYLKESIESILAQSFGDFELIIINDGSTDESEEVIREFSDPRIVLINNNENIRLISTLNKGLQNAKGKYIARMDADDIALISRFESQWKFMEANPEVDVCGSSISYFNHSGVIRSWIVLSEDKDIKTELLAGPAFAHPTVFMRTSSMRKFNISYSNEYLHTEDYELWIRMSRLGFRFHNLKDVLLHYRLHDSNVSTSGSEIQKRNHRLLQINQLENFLKRNLNHHETELLLAPANTLKVKEFLMIAKSLYREVIYENYKNKYYNNERLCMALNYLLYSKLMFSSMSLGEICNSIIPPFNGSRYIFRMILKGLLSRNEN